jgi:hypothetical protein
MWRASFAVKGLTFSCFGQANVDATVQVFNFL